jgi:acetyl esterase
MSSFNLSSVGPRTTLDPEFRVFLSKNTELHLGGSGDFHDESAHYTKCSASRPYPRTPQAPIREFTAICGPHGNIPIGVFYPKFRVEKRKVVDVATLLYFHGGGYTVRTVDEVGNGLRILAEESDVHVYAVEYRLPPEWRDRQRSWMSMRLSSSGCRARGIRREA